MSVPADGKDEALRRLGDRGRGIERARGPDPYPRPTGPAPKLDELRRRRDEIERVAARHGAGTVWVIGSVARGDAGPDSDLDLLVDMGEGYTLFGQASLQGDLEHLLGGRVHVTTTRGLRLARAGTREEIERDAVRL